MLYVENRNPSFVQFPIQNARTAYKPVFIPTILFVPWRKNRNGTVIPDSDIKNLKFLIEDVDGLVPVSDYKNRGVFKPNFDRFNITINESELESARIIVEDCTFYNSNGESINYIDAVDGDFFEYSLKVSNITDKVQYYKGAYYYDLSIFSISTLELVPLGNYKFVWQCDYYFRKITDNLDFYCINTNYLVSSRLDIVFQHPGIIHQELISKTPGFSTTGLYFDGLTLDKDNTVEFYRAFADGLQDIYDEQDLLLGVNWIDTIPPQFVSYLAYILNVDIPYFSGSNDYIRRNLIKKIRGIQNLKGSKLSVVELFYVLGYVIDVVDLWISSDKKTFIAPGENPPKGYSSDKIESNEYYIADLILNDYKTDGYGYIESGLSNRPTSQIYFYGYQLNDGSLKTSLQAISNNIIEKHDYYLNEELEEITNIIDIGLSGEIGYTNLILNENSEVVSKVDGGLGVIGDVKFNKKSNSVKFNFNRYINFEDSSVYVFAVYKYKQIDVPEHIKNNKSNRFDITILQTKDGENPTSEVIQFLLNYLDKIKAFHSLLRKLSYSLIYADVYNVSDFCLGGLLQQSAGFSAGELQIPPAVIPSTDIDCSESDRGFKQEDILLRNLIIKSLVEEHKIWKDLDDTHDGTIDCSFTQNGQDRVVYSDVDLDHNNDDRNKLCSLVNNSTDYCYKGRVKDSVEINRVLPLTENYSHNPCKLNLGQGYYYLYNDTVNDILSKVCTNNNNDFSSTEFRKALCYNPYLRYVNRDDIDFSELISNQYSVINNNSLEISKTDLFFPGHRFISMNNIENDYNSEYYYRPWDDDVVKCDSTIDLNARIEIMDGEEYLEFDDIELIYYGNGVVPDILDLSGNSETELFVTHKIYTTIESRNYDDVDTTLDYTNEDSICISDIQTPIYSSFNEDCDCGTDSSSSGKDYIDGYPSDYGLKTFDISDFDLSNSFDGFLEVMSALGLDYETTGTIQTYFTVSSGIRIGSEAYRFDCDCSRYDCDSTDVDAVDTCHIDKYLENGKFDFSQDKLVIDSSLICNETFYSDDILFGYNDINNFETTSSNFIYVDSYGIIYEVEYKIDNNIWNILTRIRDPRNYGNSEVGKIERPRVYKLGTITTHNEIVNYVDGQHTLLSEGYSQEISYFQTNFVCGDDRPTDPFVYHLNNIETENVDFTITKGSYELTQISYSYIKDNYLIIKVHQPHNLDDDEYVITSEIPEINGFDVNGTYQISLIDDFTFKYYIVGDDSFPVYGGYYNV